MNQQAYPRSLHIVQKNATSYCTPFLNYKLLVVRSSDAHVSVLQSFCLCSQCCPSQICNSQFSVIAGTYYPVSRFFLCSHVQDWWEIQVEVKLVGSNWEHWYYNDNNNDIIIIIIFLTQAKILSFALICLLKNMWETFFQTGFSDIIFSKQMNIQNETLKTLVWSAGCYERLQDVEGVAEVYNKDNELKSIGRIQ